MKKARRFVIQLFCLITFSFPSFAQWTTKANALKKRSEVPSVVYKGKLYTFLGFGDSYLNVESSSEVYDPVTNTWTLLASLPLNKTVTHQGVALIDNNVWHIGGRVGKHPGALTSEIWIYNITSNSWSPGPQIKDPATGKALLWAGGGAACVGRTLHVFGGFIQSACNSDQDLYHLTLNVDQWLANPSLPAPWKNECTPLPRKRNHFSTIVLAGKIYAIGGQTGHDCDGGQDMPYSHVYDPVSNTWKELPQLPTARSHVEGSSFAIDGKIYVVAGQKANNVNTNYVTVFDPPANSEQGSWTEQSSLALPKEYEGVSSKVIGSTFIVSHGGQGNSTNVSNTTYARTISRSPVYKLGFGGGGTQLQVAPGNSVKSMALLYTMDDTKSYSITSNASWLQVSRNSSGTAIPNGVDVELTVNTSGLALGKYRGSITATGTGSGPVYTAATYTVDLTVALEETLEAEQAVLNKAIVSSAHSGYTGSGFVDYVSSTGDYIEWTISKNSPGMVALNFRYANGSFTNRPLKVEVNGVVISSGLAFPTTGAWSNWKIAKITANLNAGVNKIRLTAIGSSGANIDNMKWSDVLPQIETLEAEQAVLNKAIVSSAHSGYTGSGFVDYVSSTGDYIEWTISKNFSGPANIDFRYANGGSTDRLQRLDINGVIVSSGLSFPPTGGWANWSNSRISVNLNSGINKVRLTAIGYSGANTDHLKWSEGPVSAASSIKSIEMGELSVIENGETNNKLEISISPNPASMLAKLSLKRSSELPVEVTITDMVGNVYKKLVLRNNINGYYDLSIHDLRSGIYLVFVQQGMERASTKLFIETK